MNKRKQLAIILMSFAFILIYAGESVSVIHDIKAGASIQDALRSSAPGDTLALSKGDYLENVIIDVPVSLIGSEGSVIRGGYESNVIHVTAAGVVLDGIHVSESGSSLSKDFAGILVEADSVSVLNCRVTRTLHGIYVKGGSNITIDNNYVEGRLDLIEADRGNGIHLWNSRNNELIGNEILNARDGIYFSFADSTSIRNNYIHHVRYGLHYMYSNDNSFVENVFINNVAGAALMYSHDIFFYRNVFAMCRGFRSYGILYQSMDSTHAENNLILDNSRGIFLNNSSNNILKSNDVVDNDLAIQLNGGCTENSFIGNNFINNLSDLILDVSDFDTKWNDESAGNHWSSYRGYDLTGEGVGDIPHNIQRIFQIMETKVPEIRFYLFSPVAMILEETERAFPIIDMGSAIDNKPGIRSIGNDEVPWNEVRNNNHRASYGAASFYFFGTSLLFMFLFVVGRNKKTGKYDRK